MMKMCMSVVVGLTPEGVEVCKGTAADVDVVAVVPWDELLRAELSLRDGIGDVEEIVASIALALDTLKKEVGDE